MVSMFWFLEAKAAFVKKKIVFMKTKKIFLEFLSFNQAV